MELRSNDFPIALQAYDLHNDAEKFVAEQLVSTRAEAERFRVKYAGKLIKARYLHPDDEDEIESAKHDPEKTSFSFPPWAIVISILLVILIAAILSGWLERILGI